MPDTVQFPRTWTHAGLPGQKGLEGPPSSSCQGDYLEKSGHAAREGMS